MSESTKLAIGLGVGVGVPAVLTIIGIVVAIRNYRINKDNNRINEERKYAISMHTIIDGRIIQMYYT